MNADNDDLDHLGPVARATGSLARRPAIAVYTTAGASILLSWLLLAAMAGRDAAARLPATPGGSLVEFLQELPLPGGLERLLALCLAPAPLGQPSLPLFSALVAMWFMMALAMMLPSAAPLVRTYCEIADTAARKGEPVVHPIVLVAGYLSVWLAAAAVFALLTLSLQTLAGGRTLDPIGGAVGSAVLGLAGLYQFSSFKHACLEKCRNPFSILFSRWTTRPSGIFRLGAGQGMWCLGCCWALMLVMLAVGVMNVFWMALIGLFTLFEKQAKGPRASRLGGAILLVWAVLLLVISA